jgi:hypothetical protein
MDRATQQRATKDEPRSDREDQRDQDGNSPVQEQELKEILLPQDVAKESSWCGEMDVSSHYRAVELGADGIKDLGPP